jgi:hypothetical protein
MFLCVKATDLLRTSVMVVQLFNLHSIRMIFLLKIKISKNQNN